MKLLLTIATVALCGALIAEAYPQQAHFQTLPYYPPPTAPPQPIRVRRQVVGGSLASNPAGGADARLELAKGIGTPDHNVIAKAFAAGNTNGGPVATGAAVGYNVNGNGIGITKEHVPGARDTLTQSAHANLFNDGVHNLDANVFKSQNTLPNGFKFERNGAGVEYSHVNGHGASFGQSNIPNFGKQLELAGRANLWSSVDRDTRFDLMGTATKWTSGPLSGQRDFGVGLGLTHMIG